MSSVEVEEDRVARSAIITGWAHSPFGKLEDPDTEGLMAHVLRPALDHAQIGPEDVDGIFVGIMNNGFQKQDFQGAVPGLIEPALASKPAVRVEDACASGSAAIYAALNFLEAGQGKVALVVGAEKMTAKPAAEIGDILLGASYRKEEAEVDGGFAGIFARIAQNYFQRYGDRSEELARIAAKNHKNGIANPFAQMRKELSFEFCNTVSDKNPYVVYPLRRSDCALVSDGAAAVVLVAEDAAGDAPRAIRFLATAHVNDVLPLSRRDPAAFDGARRAWKLALETAGLTIGDLSLAECHDCFTIAELIQYEAMGLTAPGQGHIAVREGWTEKTGKLPVNPSGGLKSKGHPIGATGVSMHIMASMQLMGEAGEMQIPDAVLAGVYNMGGAAVANFCSILERAR
jgi:acetyl-CoA C-acetyltransferase